MRLLIDECLSPALVREAYEHGIETYHVAHVGRAGWGDRQIAEYAWSQDAMLVTNNGNDFRRLYRRRALHPGLVILIPNVSRDLQLHLFREALAQLGDLGDLVNRALEIDADGDAFTRRVYELTSLDPSSP